MTTEHSESNQHEHISTKLCVQCGEMKALSEFLRRTGRRAGSQGRRGTCRDCRRGRQSVEALPAKGASRQLHHASANKHAEAHAGAVASTGMSGAAGAGMSGAASAGMSGAASAGMSGAASAGAQPGTSAAAAASASAAGSAAASAAPPPAQRPAAAGQAAAPGIAAAPASADAPSDAAAAARKPHGRGRKRRPAAQPRMLAEPPRRSTHDKGDASFLRPTASGFVRMRGKTDNGRRWYQEVELELAQILVREGAAVVVNRSTIRRLYSNKEFRKLILTRDNYICRFCGKYGDTIDHELPRAKGGHTTPANCVCACYECNQLKANRDADEFRSTLE
ncbi:HNH endonuclease [Paenibacillus sp. strain BS8-2]